LAGYAETWKCARQMAGFTEAGTGFRPRIPHEYAGFFAAVKLNYVQYLATSTPGSNAAVAGTGTTPAPDDRAAALAFLRSLAAEVSGGTVNLPSFPDVVIRIRKALADPDAKLGQTVKIIGAEPRLAARLLQAANSAAFNPSGKPVTDLKTAVTRLGYRGVQSFSMAFAVQQMRLAPALRSIAKPLNVLWKESISVASISQVIERPQRQVRSGSHRRTHRRRRTERRVARARPANRQHGWNPFVRRLALTPQDCAAILKHAEYQLRTLHATLGC
jgi:HDOD domain